MRKTFCFGGRRVARKMSERAPMVDGCVFCEIVRGAPASTTALLYSVPYHCLTYHLRSSAPLAAENVNPLLFFSPVRRMIRLWRSATSTRRRSGTFCGFLSVCTAPCCLHWSRCRVTSRHTNMSVGSFHRTPGEHCKRCVFLTRETWKYSIGAYFTVCYC